jgi:putative ABC transport system permease protein
LVRGSSAELPAALRAVVASEDAQLSPTIESLAAVRSRSVAGPRFRLLLIAAFGAFALLLAGIGIYGVIASVVQQRRREIGLRLALGSTRSAVVSAVARRCLVTVAAGTLAGLLVFWAARRVLTSMLFQVSPGDPRALAIAVAVLGVVAAFASWIPARQAAHTDPASSLRVD